MENEMVYSTRDLYLASTLITLRFKLEGVDFCIEGSKESPIGYFKFTDSPALREAESKYLQCLLSVEPKAFVGNMRSLKAEVSNMQRNPHMSR